MLNIENLSVTVSDKSVIDTLNWSVEEGTLQILMGPNGSGKSTLTQALAGHPLYEAQGQVWYRGVDLLALPPHERAYHGLFIAFQYPVELPGVTLMTFLKTIVNAHRQAKKLPLLDAMDFMKQARETIQEVGLDESFLYRSVNQGFSGGEKKRCELLQILLLNPSLIILDETDSGLDIDAFKLMVDLVQKLRSPDRTIIVITHYDQFLQAMKPDKIQIFLKGKIVAQGQEEVAQQLRLSGYASFEGYDVSRL